MLIPVILSACQAASTPITILADGKTITLATDQRIPARILADAGITLAVNDRLLYRGATTPLDTALPPANSYALAIRRAVSLTVVSPQGQKIIQTSAFTIGQALSEAGYPLYKADRLDPPAETPIEGSLTVNYQPAQNLLISEDAARFTARSAATTVGQALAEAGLPLIGLDSSLPPEGAPLPADGRIQVTRVVENVALVQKSIPFATRTEPSADLELDQQALTQGGEPGIAITRVRSRSQDGLQVSQKTEGETIVRPPQDRILGYGTRVVIRTATVDGVTFQYYRALTLNATSYSPCRSATPDGKCSYGTSSGLPVQRGTVAMVYSWYLAFGFDRLYIPGYGFATVGDVGGGPPGSHYWIDLGWTDAEYQPLSGMMTVYFLTPVPKNLVYVLP